MDEFAFTGYPVSEVGKRYGLTHYSLQDFEKESVLEVRKCISKQGFYDKETAEEHLSLLESLAKKLTIIIEIEEKEGLSNLELKKDLVEIKRLCYLLNDLIPAL